MRTSEVLAQYKNGERDFQGVNLRGQSFRGQNLSGADFSGADIRGTNFRTANLRGTKFCRARAGFKVYWPFIIVLFSFLISALAGFTSAIISTFVLYLFFDKKLSPILLFFPSVIFITLIRKTLEVYFTEWAVNLNIGLAIAVILAVTFFGVPAAAVDEPEAQIGGIIVITSALMISLIIYITGKWANDPLIGAILGGTIGAFLGCWFGREAIDGDQRFSWIWKIYLRFTIIGGTTFYRADLTNANFTDSVLKNTDLRAKSLIRTCFKKTVKLHLARPGNTLLANPAVRELLITGQGAGKNYTDANLRGANLIGANLQDAILKLADFGDATLEYANLEGANLSQVNAVGTNFTRASLTGACIEAWNIESSTVLDDVDCHYLYLLEYPKPKTDDRERRPSSGEFQAGEFTKLFAEVMDTVDLIFRNGVDWKAFVAAFKQVQVENQDTPLEIQSIDNKGDGVVVVKVHVPPDTDKEKIHREFTDYYGLALKAVEEKYKAQLEAKESEIIIYRQQSTNMMEITKLLASKPINVEATAMTHSSDSSKKISVGRDFNVADSVVNLADTIGEVNNAINRLPDNPTPDKSGIKELLTQLKTAIDELPTDDKQQALQQIQTLAEAASDPKNEEMQKKAKKAIGFLKVISDGLEPAAKLVSAGKALLPAIAAFFGF